MRVITSLGEELGEELEKGVIDERDLKVVIPQNQLRPSKFVDRLTLRIEAYWETFHEEPVGTSVLATRLLESFGIEPYIRRFVATEEPRELFLGDIDRAVVGYILLVNTEGIKLLRNPSDEERAAFARRVAVFNGFEIHPKGMPFFGHVSKEGPLLVHCLEGEAVLQTYIFPR